MMTSTLINTNFDRRRFLSGIVPACAVSCFGLRSAFALTQTKQDALVPEGKHKFDQDLGRTITHRQFFGMRYREYIELTKALKSELGEKKAIDFLKKYTKEKMLEFGKNHAGRSPDNGFQTYTDTFRDLDRYKNTLTMEIVEDTEKAFELKVTECIWASTFLEHDVGDIGYASVCIGDYTWASGFNPKIKLVRDKTLMEGHEYCNHRYILEG
jgi:hypothetical protein